MWSGKMQSDKVYIVEKLDIASVGEILAVFNSLKGVTSRLLRQEFPELKKILGGEHFWSPSYCLITTGQVTLDKLKKYVESQGKNESI